MRILLFLCFLLFAYSCTTQDPVKSKSEPSKATEALTWAPDLYPEDNDPYFNSHPETVRKVGPSAITRNVLQDKNGDMWLATWNGIIKYDGKAFLNLTNKEMLRRYRAFCILEDGKGDLWFGTIGAGVYHYDGKQFTNYTVENGVSDDKVECIAEDKEGNIWFGHDKGVSVLKRTSLNKEQPNFEHFGVAEGIADGDVHDIMVDKEGKVWIASTGGINIYDGQEIIEFRMSNGSSFKNVRTLLEDQNGQVWIGGNDGLIHYNGKSFTTLNSNFVGYLYETAEGMIYCSIEDGVSRGNIILARFKAPMLPFQITKLEPEVVFDRNEMVCGITQDETGNIWFGTVNGVYKYDGQEVYDFKE